MIRIDAMIHERQLDFLRSLEGTISEHIRRAIDNYSEKFHTSATSPTKKGGQNG